MTLLILSSSKVDERMIVSTAASVFCHSRREGGQLFLYFFTIFLLLSAARCTPASIDRTVIAEKVRHEHE